MGDKTINMLFFKLEELCPKDVFEKEGARAWLRFQNEALLALDNLREFFRVPITVNNWHVGGQFQYRGYRPPDCRIGAKLSQHRLGNAFDCDIKGYTAEEARQKILSNQNHLLLRSITRLEAAVGWLHFDLGNIPKGKERIYIFKP